MERDEVIQETVFLLGCGRVGRMLASALQRAQVTLAGIWNRRERPDCERLPCHRGELPLSLLRQAGVLFLTVSDQAIGALAERLLDEGALSAGQRVFHCSGVLSREVLSPLRQAGCAVGVFHPLCAIVDEPAPSGLQGVAIGIDADDEAHPSAVALAQTLGARPFELAGVDRALYHVAAVLTSNALMALVDQAASLLEQAGLREDPLALLGPLLRSASHNLDEYGLPRALTGPLSRGDRQSVALHLQRLQEQAPHLLPLYRALAHPTLDLARRLPQNLRPPAEALQEIADLLAGSPQKIQTSNLEKDEPSADIEPSPEKQPPLAQWQEKDHYGSSG